MKSLDKIFKNFRKTLNQLDDYIAKTQEEINGNEIQMVEIQSENITHRFNSEKASNARDKIADLIGDNE